MVIVDTDVFIAAIRNHEVAKTILEKYGNKIALSAVTALELYVGANTAVKKRTVEKILADHQLILIDKSISTTAIKLVKDYNTHSRSLYMPDALIAATCLERGTPLITFNNQDFKFIKGLKLAK